MRQAMADNRTVNGGLRFSSALAIVLIGLKVAGVITLPWVWVLSPIWIPAVAYVAFMAIAIAMDIRLSRKMKKKEETNE